jgi:nucleotide-binding universal stress UspA family protein
VGVPVLLIRPIHTPAEPASVAGMRHILVPLDGSPLAEAILPHVMGIARLSGARVTLVEAVAPVYSISGGAHTADVGIDVRAAETAHNESARYLEHVAGRLRRDHVEADVAVITHWQAAHAIIDYANDHGVDLIAMATHGRGAWSRWVIGSVADKVMRGCHIPMLVLRPARGRAG